MYEPQLPVLNPSPGTKPTTGSSRPGPLAHPVDPVHPAHLPAAPSPAPLTFEALLRALQRRWLRASLLSTVVAVAIFLLAWYFLPESKHTVRAMVHISARPQSILPRLLEGDAGFGNFQKTQMTLVRSQVVLDAALKQPGIADLDIIKEQETPKTWLVQELEIDFSQGPEVLRISMKGNRPEELVLLVNAIMKAYLAEFVNTEEVNRKARREQLQDLKKQHSKLLEQKTKLLRTYTPHLGANKSSADHFRELKLKQLALAQQDLLSVRASLPKKKLEITGLEQSREATKTREVPLTSDLERELAQDAVIKRHAERLADLEQQIDDIRKKAGTAAPNLIAERGLDKDVEASQKAIDARRAALLPDKQEQIRKAALRTFDDKIEQAKQDQAILVEQEKMLVKVIEDLSQETSALGSESFEMLQSSKEVEEEEKILGTINTEVRQLDLDLLSPPRAKQLDEAVVTRASDFKKRLLVSSGSSGAGFLLVLFGIAWLELRAHRVTSVDAVVLATRIRLVGTLPPLAGKSAVRKNSVALLRSLTDSIDSYRTLLMRSAHARPVRVVMITSAMPSEGKTTLASHLAASLARTGQKVLLLDSDMRNPTAHRLFDLPVSPGLGEVLRGECPLAEAIRPTTGLGLSIITAGTYDARALCALAQPSMAQLFDNLRSQFDVIVLDSCPVLPVPDTLLIGQHVDGVILSMLHDVSRLPKVMATLHRLETLGIGVLGAVVSGTTEDVHGYPYPMSVG